MPTMTPYQSSFASGHLSPKMQGRIDLEQYFSGLAQTTNWFVHPQGPIQRRNGSELITIFDPAMGGYSEDDEKGLSETMMIPCYRGFPTPIVLIFTKNYIHFYYKGGMIQGQVSGVLSSTEFPTYTAPDGNHALCTNPFCYFPRYFKNMDWVQVDEDHMVIVAPHVPPVRLVARDWNDWRMGLIGFYTIDKYGEMPPELKPIAEGDGTEGGGSGGEENPDNPDEGGEEEEKDMTPWPYLSEDWGIDRDKVDAYGSNVHLPYPPLPYDPAEDPLDMRGPTGYNWPTRCAMFERRLVFASSELFPQKISFSRVASPYDFRTDTTVTAGDTTETRVLDSDGIDIDIESGTDTFITWLLSTTSLVVGMQDAEYRVGGASGEAITPNNVRVTKQSTFGSSKIKAQLIGSDAAFVTKNFKSLIMYTFNLLTDTWEGTSAGILADDITAKGIVSLSIQSSPITAVWVVLKDGTLGRYVYDKKQKLSYWFEYKTEGFYKQVIAIPTDEDDEILVVVYRPQIKGSTVNSKFCLERFNPEIYDIDHPEDSLCVDSYLRYEGTPANYLTGLDHLKGLQVQAVSEGKNLGTYIVDNNGGVRLNQSVTKCAIGLGFTSRAVTMTQSPQGQLLIGNEKSLYRADFWLSYASNLRVGLLQHYVADYKTAQPVWVTLVPPNANASGIQRSNLRCSAWYDVRIVIETLGPEPAAILGIKAFMEAN